MNAITVTKSFNESLTVGLVNGSFCLMSDGMMVSFNRFVPYTPLGGRKAVKAIIASGFVIDSKLFLLSKGS